MSLRIILVGTKHSGNVGSVARAMKNFGLSELVLVAPRCRLDRQAYAMASHAGELLDGARVVDRAVDAVSGCTLVLGTTARERASPAYRVSGPREAVRLLPASGGALMFGPEDTGLNNSDLDMCQGAVRIPTAEYASLNLAQAVNVLAYEWFVRDGAKVSAEAAGAGEARSSTEGPSMPSPAPREEVEPMIAQLMELLDYIGYTGGPKAVSVEHMFRRILDRAALSSREVAALRGLWSQARWAADRSPDTLPGRRRTR